MAWEAALETVLPELREPGVPSVGVQTQLQVVVIKGLDHLGLQLHGDTSLCFLLIPFHNLVTICPPVTAGAREEGEIMIQSKDSGEDTTALGDTAALLCRTLLL